MKKTNGFTLIELLITIAMIILFLAIVTIPFMNPPGKTEAKASEAAQNFIKKNSLEVKRNTCAHDSDGDGQASCTIALADGEKIFLSCPVSIFNTFMGAESCKEVDTMSQIAIKRR